MYTRSDQYRDYVAATGERGKHYLQSRSLNDTRLRADAPVVIRVPKRVTLTAGYVDGASGSQEFPKVSPAAPYRRRIRNKALRQNVGRLAR